MGGERFLLCFLFYLVKILWILDFQIGDFCKDKSKELGTNTVHLPPKAALVSSAETYHSPTGKMIMPRTPVGGIGE